jgi:O-antigen/teichoic acid export membrane protein
MAKRSILRDITSVSSISVVNIILQIPIGIIIARMLGPEGNGTYALLLIVPNIVGTITRFGVKKSSIYFIGKKSYSVEELLSAFLYLFVASSILGILLSFIIYYKMGSPVFQLPYMLLALALIPMNIITNYSVGIFVGKEQIRRFNLFQWAPIVLNLLSVILFVYLLKWSIFGALLSFLLSNMLMAAYALSIVFKEYRLNTSFNFKLIKSLVGLGLLFVIGGFLIKLHYRVDLILLKELSDLKEVGLYSIASRLAERWQAPFTIGVIITSRTANAKDQKQLAINISRLIRILFTISVIAYVILYVLAPILIPFLYGQKFTPSVVILQAILPGILFLVVLRTLTSHFSGAGKALTIIWITASSLLLNIGLNYWLIPQYGGVGAAIATDISYFLATIIFTLVFAIRNKISFHNLFVFQKEDLRLVKGFWKRKHGK